MLQGKKDVPVKIPKNTMNYFFRPPVKKTKTIGVNKIAKY